MTKIHAKLLVFFSILVCSLCLVCGLTACNSGGHTHIFGGFWQFNGADGHYRLATCHPEAKSVLEPHADESGDSKCDVCGYVMHEHTDGNDDNICDDCKTVIHRHTFEDEWSFSENNHWHEATCEHFIERSDYAAHIFSGGVCECGVKESEAKVYSLYKKSPENNLYFLQWLDWLADEGIIEVEYTESGDGIYHYEDGTKKACFFGERTVKVKAESDNGPLADVWFMVAMYNPRAKTYYESNGTIALGIAKTDSSGIAKITFSPVGGYSSDVKEYRVQIAEAKDIAFFQGVDEEDASRAIPNRYELKGGINGLTYMPYEVSENGSDDSVAVTMQFSYSAGWNAYDTFALSYRRYFEDPVNGEGLKEEGFTYEFMSSGGNLFDYFTFSPAKYSFASSSSLEDFNKIEENAKLAAAGIYKISFEAKGNAELYYWNELGVNLGGFHYAYSDGTPHNMYLTAQSGGTAGTDKYSGGNFVKVKIVPSLGLRNYQFGIKTDIECNVTLTVERIGDIGSDTTFEWDKQTNKSEVTVDIPQNETMTFALNGVPEGLYVLTVPQRNSSGSDVGRYYVWTNDDKQKFFVGEYESWQSSKPLNKAIIRITKNTNTIYLQNTLEEYKNRIITLEKYELPKVEIDEFAVVPVTPVTYKNSYTLPLSVSAGTYKLSVRIAGKENGGTVKPLSVYIGDKQIQLTKPSIYVSGNITYYTYSGTIEIGENDNTISMRCSTEYLFNAGIQISQIA